MTRSRAAAMLATSAAALATAAAALAASSPPRTLGCARWGCDAGASFEASLLPPVGAGGLSPAYSWLVGFPGAPANASAAPAGGLGCVSAGAQATCAVPAWAGGGLAAVSAAGALLWANAGDTDHDPATIKVFSSDDGVTYTLVDTVDSSALQGSKAITALPVANADTRAKFWRINPGGIEKQSIPRVMGLCNTPDCQVKFSPACVLEAIVCATCDSPIVVWPHCR